MSKSINKWKCQNWCKWWLIFFLHFQFMLHIAPPKIICPRYKSGGDLLCRPVSHGHQDFQTHKDLYPLNKPMPKLEATIQCSGEARYANDIPLFPAEVFGAFVLSTVYSGEIDTIDASEVLVSS